MLWELCNDVDVSFSFYADPLQAAAREGHIIELLQHGAGMNDSVSFFDTPLIVVVERGHEDIVRTFTNVDVVVELRMEDSKVLLPWHSSATTNSTPRTDPKMMPVCTPGDIVHHPVQLPLPSDPLSPPPPSSPNSPDDPSLLMRRDFVSCVD